MRARWPALEKDKKNEADCLMDGAWTGHPDQNQIALDQFPFPNQLQARRAQAERYPNLRPAPKNVGQRTLAGTRAAVRTVIRYRNGVLNGKGASLLDGYMEDLATDRIYRLMIAQRMRHNGHVPVTRCGTSRGAYAGADYAIVRRRAGEAAGESGAGSGNGGDVPRGATDQRSDDRERGV